MKKGIILFDIDRTIFDTVRLSETLRLELQRVIKKVSLEDIREVMNEFTSSLGADREFDPEQFTKFLCNRFDFLDQKLLLDVFYDPANKHWYRDFIFQETFTVFEKLKNRFRMGIYSEGTKKFQNYKFDSMEILKYLDRDLIFILDHKTNPDAVKKIPKGSIVVDDKESVCEFLVENGIKVIWLNKKDDRKNANFSTIHNLLELCGRLM